MFFRRYFTDKDFYVLNTILLGLIFFCQVLITSVEAPAGYSDLASVAVTGAAKPHLVHISTILFHSNNA